MTDWRDIARAAAANTAYPDTQHGTKSGWGEAPVTVRLTGVPNPISLSWNDGTGNCRGGNTDVFYPDRGLHTSAAVAVCLDGPCPLLEPCRAHGIRHEAFGVWGGLTEAERRAERRRSGAATPLGRPIAAINHGTPWGYYKHRRFPHLFGEPCADCRRAVNNDRQVRRDQIRQAIKKDAG